MNLMPWPSTFSQSDIPSCSQKWLAARTLPFSIWKTVLVLKARFTPLRFDPTGTRPNSFAGRRSPGTQPVWCHLKKMHPYYWKILSSFNFFSSKTSKNCTKKEIIVSALHFLSEPFQAIKIWEFSSTASGECFLWNSHKTKRFSKPHRNKVLCFTYMTNIFAVLLHDNIKLTLVSFAKHRWCDNKMPIF